MDYNIIIPWVQKLCWKQSIQRCMTNLQDIYSKVIKRIKQNAKLERRFKISINHKKDWPNTILKVILYW